MDYELLSCLALFSLLFRSFFSAFTLDFLLLSLCASWSQFALSAGNLLKLCVCLCITLVCVHLHACVCGKSAKVAGKGEATECTTVLTWWQMKIKRLLLKIGGVCFQMGLCGHVQDEERAMARNEGWAIQKRRRAHRHRAGLGEQGGGFVFLAAQLKDLSFFPPQNTGSKMSWQCR